MLNFITYKENEYIATNSANTIWNNLLCNNDRQYQPKCKLRL